MSFDKMIEEFKDFADLQKYSETQYKTIIELTKKVSKLEEENKHLKLMVEQNVPLLPSDNKAVVLDAGTDQEIIAEVQLKRLKETSHARELTMEEAKKVETYTKVLTTMRAQKPKAIELDSKDFGEKELLKLVENPNE